MEDFYIGGASVKLFLPIFKINFPEIVDLALPAEGVFHNLVFVSIKKTYPMQAYKIMHGLWGMGQMMFTKYLVVVDDDVNDHNTSEVLFQNRPLYNPLGAQGGLDPLPTGSRRSSRMEICAPAACASPATDRLWPSQVCFIRSLSNFSFHGVRRRK